MSRLQTWLLAPAVVGGLMAPLVVQASDLHREEQVISVSQFSDLRPSDWAFQALSNLIERYGCVAGYPNGSFAGGRAISRFEAAALLNACSSASQT